MAWCYRASGRSRASSPTRVKSVSGAAVQLIATAYTCRMTLLAARAVTVGMCAPPRTTPGALEGPSPQTPDPAARAAAADQAAEAPALGRAGLPGRRGHHGGPVRGGQAGPGPGYVPAPVRHPALLADVAGRAAGRARRAGRGLRGGPAPAPAGVHARRPAGRLLHREHADGSGWQRPGLLRARRVRAVPGGGHLRGEAGRGARPGGGVHHAHGRRRGADHRRARRLQRKRDDPGRAPGHHRLDDRLQRAPAPRVRGPAAGRGGQQGGGPGTPAHRAGTARRGRAQHERHRGPGGLRPVRHRQPAGRRAGRARRHPDHEP